jgi:hypothetical protein
MIGLGDPGGTGLVVSLAKPGGNVTGMSMMVPEVATKRLELLKEAAPGISRVLVLSYLADPIAPLPVKAMQQAAGSLGVLQISIRLIGLCLCADRAAVARSARWCPGVIRKRGYRARRRVYATGLLNGGRIAGA